MFVARKSIFAGFSLLELSVVLVIMGVTISGALSIATRATIASLDEENSYKMDRIELAISEFVRKNKRLPCPGKMPTTMTDDEFGLESWVNDDDATADTCDNGTSIYTGALENFGVSGHVFAGHVPFVTLGLDQSFAIDAWGHRFNYVVDDRFVSSAATYTDCDGVTSDECFEYMPDDITDGIQVEASVGEVTPSRTQAGAYLLMSFGANGVGSIGRNGGNPLVTGLISEGDYEVINNHLDDGYVTAYDNLFIQMSASDEFDDTVRYKEKWQIIGAIAETPTESVCDLAKTIVDSPGSNGVCEGATSVSDCEQFASEIDNVCAGMYN